MTSLKTPEETLGTKRTFRKVTFLVDEKSHLFQLEKNKPGSVIQTWIMYRLVFKGKKKSVKADVQIKSEHKFHIDNMIVNDDNVSVVIAFNLRVV